MIKSTPGITLLILSLAPLAAHEYKFIEQAEGLITLIDGTSATTLLESIGTSIDNSIEMAAADRALMIAHKIQGEKLGRMANEYADLKLKHQKAMGQLVASIDNVDIELETLRTLQNEVGSLHHWAVEYDESLIPASAAAPETNGELSEEEMDLGMKMVDSFFDTLTAMAGKAKAAGTEGRQNPTEPLVCTCKNCTIVRSLKSGDYEPLESLFGNLGKVTAAPTDRSEQVRDFASDGKIRVVSIRSLADLKALEDQYGINAEQFQADILAATGKTLH